MGRLVPHASGFAAHWQRPCAPTRLARALCIIALTAPRAGELEGEPEPERITPSFHFISGRNAV